MSCQSADLPDQTRWLVEDAELPQHRPTVVVDFFSGQTIIGVERVHPAKWKLDPSPSRRQTAPPAEMRSANYDFDNNRILSHMPLLYLDL
jgi:hypothetical protein